MIPHWVFACVVNGDFRVKEQAKVAFFLAPWVPPHAHVSSAKGGADGTRTPQHTSHGRRAGTADGVGTSAGGRTYQASQRFTAPMQMLVSKVRRLSLCSFFFASLIFERYTCIGSGCGDL